ncbi:MAG: thioredoxin fold domain-containing protein [Pseudomonadota bacterium]
MHLFKNLFGILCCGLFPILTQAAIEASLPPSLVNPGYHEQPAWFTQSFLDLGEDIAEADAADKQLILYFYQDGCPYCARLLRDNFGNPAIARQVQDHFHVVALNIWGDREVTDLKQQITTEKAYALAERVHYTPTLIFLDNKGETLLRLNGYLPPDKFHQALNYVIAQREPQSRQKPDTAASQNTQPLPPMAAALPHPLRLATDTPRERPLLVIFSESDCTDCTALHQRLQQPAIATALTNLDVALLNRWSPQRVQTPSGDALPAIEWARRLQLHFSPSLVFFDRNGQEIFRAETSLESFHLHAVLDYVISGAYQHQPSFQRFLQHRGDTLEARGIPVALLDPPGEQP